MSVIAQLDDKYYQKLNSFARLPWVRNMMLALTQMGSGIFVTLVCIGCYFLHLPQVILGILFTQGLVQSIKRIVRRTRPYWLIEDAIPVHPPKCQYSFPSGHTASAMTLAFMLSYYFHSMALVFMALGGIVAISRMVLGVHYPSDVLAGVGIAMVSFFIFKGAVPIVLF